MEPISDAHRKYLDRIIENYTATPKYDSEFLNYALRPVVAKKMSVVEIQQKYGRKIGGLSQIEEH